MGTRIGQWTLDVRDVELMARFWSAALGYRLGDDGQHLWPPADAGPLALSVWLQPVDEPTPGKNRGHPDLYPTAATRTPRLSGCSPSVHGGPTSGRPARRGSWFSPIRRATSSAFLRRAPDEVPDPDE